MFAVVLGHDNKYLVSGGKDNLVILWNFFSGQLLSRLAGHTEQVWGLALTVDN